MPGERTAHTFLSLVLENLLQLSVFANKFTSLTSSHVYDLIVQLLASKLMRIDF